MYSNKLAAARECKLFF